MRRKSLKTLLGIWLVLTLSNCAQVKIKDAEWCGPYPDKSGASCFNTLSDDSRDLDASQWDATLYSVDQPMVCTSSDSLANWKAAILKFCSKSKLCTFEFKKKVSEFRTEAPHANPRSK